MERRDFIKICAATAAIGAQPALAARNVEPRFYSRGGLVDDHGQPLKASSLTAGENYIFHYPFEGTPCFLLNLGRPTVRDVRLKTEHGGTYVWPGGVGPNRAVVGYSPIFAPPPTPPPPQIHFLI